MFTKEIEERSVQNCICVLSGHFVGNRFCEIITIQLQGALPPWPSPKAPETL